MFHDQHIFMEEFVCTNYPKVTYCITISIEAAISYAFIDSRSEDISLTFICKNLLVVVVVARRRMLIVLHTDS